MPICHPFPPYLLPNSRVLVLGSFPSVRSRAEGFYYGHPSNRFWRLLAQICQEELPGDIKSKKQLLARCHIALWDVIESCEITGSSDLSIRNARVNPIADTIRHFPIQAILLNGNAAARLYNKQVHPKPELPALPLPSTSAANAAWSLDRLIAIWQEPLRNFRVQ